MVGDGKGRILPVENLSKSTTVLILDPEMPVVKRWVKRGMPAYM